MRRVCRFNSSAAAKLFEVDAEKQPSKANNFQLSKPIKGLNVLSAHLLCVLGRSRMPRELKKRGRREEKKRKRNDASEAFAAKRQRTDEEDASQDPSTGIRIDGNAGDDFIGFSLASNDSAPLQRPEQQFYGLLEPEEQEYYANVNNKINADDFESEEDRQMFIEAVHRELKGKEIKVASSQSCSRYLEKIIQLSTVEQLRSLFSAFLQDLNYLVLHRFGSHCCETLFTQTVRYIQRDPSTTGEDSIEPLFLSAVQQIKPHIGYLLTEKFASHTIRVLLVVLSGESLQNESLKSMLASRKKEKLDLPRTYEEEQKVNEQAKRKVPESFSKALRDLISLAVSGLDTTYLRALATHQTGNPVLQLLLRLELTTPGRVKDNNTQTPFTRLFPEDDFDAESESGKFASGLVYDSTGSHLVEVLVQHLPGKMFKKFYKNLFKERIGKLAKNEIATYVAMRILQRIGKDELADARDKILPEIPGLIERKQLMIIRILVQRCAVRQVDQRPLARAIVNAYGGTHFNFLPQMLQFSLSEGTGNAAREETDLGTMIDTSKADLQGSLLAQEMLRTGGGSDMIQDCLLSQSDAILTAMSKNPILSRVLQVALTSSESSNSFRRQLIPKFHGRICELAIDPAGSHVVDALWEATSGSHFLKEGVAQEMQQGETTLRDSKHGRTVWRNWSMDLYQRRPRDWQAKAKGHDIEPQETPQDGVQKTPIELARERYAQKQAKSVKQNGKQPYPVSANA